MNGRKARQLRSQGGQRRFRRGLKQNRATAEQHNAAMAAYAAEEAEAQQYHDELVAKLQLERQFAIRNPFTNEIVMLAAESMIHELDMTGVNLDDPADGDPFAVENPATPEEAAAETAQVEQETAEYLHGDDTPDHFEGNIGANIAGGRIILPGTAAALGIETP